MCGRFVLAAPESEVAKQFQLDLTAIPAAEPRFNIAPSQEILAVRVRPDNVARVAEMMSWGLVPAWTKDLAEARKPINAKAETVDTLPTFKNAFHRRRCIVPATGFYEWRDVGEKRKQPYYFHMRGAELFGFAGLWEFWRNAAGGDPLVSCTLITTTPNAVAAPIHNRMPAILHREDYGLWLDPEAHDTSLLKSLLRPYPPEEMEAYPVPPLVSRVGTEGPELIARTDVEGAATLRM